MVDWFIYLLIDWIIDWLIDWLVAWFFCKVNPQQDRPSASHWWIDYWLIIWLIDWLIDWIFQQESGWQREQQGHPQQDRHQPTAPQGQHKQTNKQTNCNKIIWSTNE